MQDMMKIYLGLLGMITCTVTANIILKISANKEVTGEYGYISRFVSMQTFSGLLLFGLGVTFYFYLLRLVPLNVAQSFAAIQFIGVILASRLILLEPISTQQWLGIGLITLGIIVVGCAKSA